MSHMKNKVVVVTGATNGIGESIAESVAKQGAHTIIVSRNEQKCRDTTKQLKQSTGNPHINYYVVDLSSQAEIRLLVAQLNQDLDRLDVLINNAGAWFTDQKYSADGIEMTWALNHMNYFLVTNGLLDLIKSTAERFGDARIINQSSAAHLSGEFNWDNLEFEGTWDTEAEGTFGAGWGAYSQSKLANAVHAFKLARELAGTGVVANAVHPASVVTGFTQNNGILYKIAAPVRRLFNRMTTEEAAEPAVWFATEPEAASITGKYYGPPHQEDELNPMVRDEDIQDRLWAISEEYAQQEVAAF